MTVLYNETGNTQSSTSGRLVSYTKCFIFIHPESYDSASETPNSCIQEVNPGIFFTCFKILICCSCFMLGRSEASVPEISRFLQENALKESLVLL